MTTLTLEMTVPEIERVAIGNNDLSVVLNDGRRMSVPLTWYPRLLNGSKKERANFRIIGGGEGIHWPDLDEDISVENILSGKISSESQKSFHKWIENRKLNGGHRGA